MSELKSKNKARGGHKSYLTQIFPEVDACLEEYDESRKDQLTLWKEILEEQLETIVAFDREIQAIMESDDKVTEEHLATEIYESVKVRSDVRIRISRISERLAAETYPTSTPIVQSQPLVSPPPAVQQSPEIAEGQQNPAPHPTPSIRANLPKLEVRKFGGKISEWQEFWDSFESAIDKNESLANVDKFSYLRGLLIEPARSAIAGFALTSANYGAAVELLKKRYG